MQLCYVRSVLSTLYPFVSLSALETRLQSLASPHSRFFVSHGVNLEVGVSGFGRCDEA